MVIKTHAGRFCEKCGMSLSLRLCFCSNAAREKKYYQVLDEELNKKVAKRNLAIVMEELSLIIKLGKSLYRYESYSIRLVAALYRQRYWNSDDVEFWHYVSTFIPVNVDRMLEAFFIECNSELFEKVSGLEVT